MTDPRPIHDREMRKNLCARAANFRDTHCGPFDQMDPELLGDCSVVDSIFIAAINRCMLEPSCAAMQACATKVRLQGGTYEGPTGGCELSAGESATIPAGFSEADIADSYGRLATKFSAAPSTKDHPIEVCGMPDQLAYLTRVTCNDGGKPFADRTAADHARVGNVGPGGRCKRVVDEYAVPCPEATYQVFIDPYRCPAR